jgi:hypothetical protein
MTQRRYSTERSEIEALLQRSIVEEAISTAWDNFEKALGELGHESVSLLSDFFNGKPPEELARQRGMELKDVEKWLASAKQQLIQNLRTKCKVKQ